MNANMRTLNIDPEIVTKLSSGDSKLWLAAHEDGSDNRINGDVILRNYVTKSQFLISFSGTLASLATAYGAAYQMAYVIA